MPHATRLGRPKKYGRPARAVTVTLPEDILKRLSAIHANVGSAIVHLAEQRVPARVPPIPAAEIARYGNHAVIIVTPSRALKRLRGVQLVPIGDGRALISLAPSMSISALELQVRDALERADVQEREREVLKSIADILRRGRASRRGWMSYRAGCRMWNSMLPQTLQGTLSRNRSGRPEKYTGEKCGSEFLVLEPRTAPSSYSCRKPCSTGTHNRVARMCATAAAA